MPNFYRIAAGAALLVALVAPARALDTPEVDFRFSVWGDVVHSPGSLVVSGRYGGAWGLRAGAWMHDTHAEEGAAKNKLAGFDHVWEYAGWRAGLGAVWIDQKTNLSGTHWDFDVSLSYDLVKHVSVEFHHFSHAKKLGISEETPNGGWNLLGLALIF